MLKPSHPHRHDPHRAHVHAPEESHDPAPLPPDLWAEAEKQHPRDAKKRQARYVELMTEHGHLAPAE